MQLLSYEWQSTIGCAAIGIVYANIQPRLCKDDCPSSAHQTCADHRYRSTAKQLVWCHANTNVYLKMNASDKAEQGTDNALELMTVPPRC